ncbi:MAG: tRNA (N(6)-L-threonylcarbamoyladenosine(37)-C(2))-methylthiotransferase MtaB, partial [Bryobacteraceae bacterium]
PFTYLHVFTYSERPGTTAAEGGDPVPVELRRERTRVLRGLSDRKNLEFRRRMIGARLSAVTLEQRGIALTTNFLKVELAEKREPNHMVDVEIGGASEVGLRERNLLQVL